MLGQRESAEYLAGLEPAFGGPWDAVSAVGDVVVARLAGVKAHANVGFRRALHLLGQGARH